MHMKRLWLVGLLGLGVAAFFGLCVLGVFFLVRRSGGVRRAGTPLATVLGLIALQGALGIVQYQLKLPAELVWVHIALATLTWLVSLPLRNVSIVDSLWSLMLFAAGVV